MEVLLWVFGFIITIGLIRIIFKPFTGFGNFIMEMLLIDLLVDLLSAIVDSIDEME